MDDSGNIVVESECMIDIDQRVLYNPNGNVRSDLPTPSTF